MPFIKGAFPLNIRLTGNNYHALIHLNVFSVAVCAASVGFHILFILANSDRCLPPACYLLAFGRQYSYFGVELIINQKSKSHEKDNPVCCLTP